MNAQTTIVLFIRLAQFWQRPCEDQTMKPMTIQFVLPANDGAAIQAIRVLITEHPSFKMGWSASLLGKEEIPATDFTISPAKSRVTEPEWRRLVDGIAAHPDLNNALRAVGESYVSKNLFERVQVYAPSHGGPSTRSITVEERSGDIMAYANGDRRFWDAGPTVAEAIGRCVRTHHDSLGLKLTVRIHQGDAPTDGIMAICNPLDAGYAAYFNGDRAICGTGMTVDEAVGDLVRTHTDALGVTVEVPTHGFRR
jgi:hypothetical protein